MVLMPFGNITVSTLMPWIFRHSGEVITKHRVRRDGETPYQKLKGKSCRTKTVPFGECVLFKRLKGGDERRNRLEMQLEEGIWVGVCEITGSHIVLTKGGPQKCRTIKR